MENEEPKRNGDAPAPSVIRFGPYELNLRSAELSKNDLRIRLQDQPFQVLIALIERPGEVVLREEIRKRLWPDDTVVEFDHGINAAVKRLRDVLCESAEKPRYIETLARRGYRFIGKVEAEEELQKEADTLAVEPSNGQPLLETGIAESGTNELLSLERAQWKTPLRSTRIPGRGLPAVVVLLVVAGAWVYHRRAPARWAREVALPEATRLLNAGDNAEAFPFLYRALQILPEDAELMKLRRGVSYACLINTNPPGANVQVKSYGAPDSDWLSIGQSPIKDFLLPVGYFRWRITKPGFQTLEAAASGARIEFKLYPEHSAPPEMVHVPSGIAPVFGLRHRLDDYLIDKYEVTNRQFKEFVEHGGYQDQRYWRQEFVDDGRMLSWAEAMEHFRDATGRAGPSTWEVGTYPAGRGEFPVTGVSWYEAHAYAEFAKRQLPSIYHWYRAADQGIYSDILKFSNFGGSGPVQVGSRPSLGAFGTYDIAGNVKEWCSNATGQRRYILGGSWNEGRSYFVVPDALPPFHRSSESGFRCIRSASGSIPDELNRPVDKPKRDYRTESPVSDDTFRILQSFYAYDETELNAKRESVDDSSPYWRVEKITFDAAYDRQRVIAFVYLPKNAKPPYQTVLFCPSGHGRVLSNIDEAEMNVFDFLMRSGRAVLFPVTQGMYSRRHTIPRGPNSERDLLIQQSKDIRRSLDYLVTRTDILPDRIGLFGMSGGSRMGLITLGQETRIRTAILAQGGLSAVSTPPETDGINFAPRVRIPVLMLNGRYDFVFPIETGQLPMLRFLGSPDKDKRNVLFDTGHAGATKPLIKETLDWLDLYLGPTGK